MIIPFHTINDFLLTSINSVKASKNVKVRVIAVNDTGQYVTKEGIGLEAIDILVINLGKGYLDAMATGVSQIESKFVGFQDSDDFTDPFRFFNQLKLLEDTNADLVTGHLVKVNSFGKSIKNKPIFGRLPDELTPKQKLIFGPHGADSTLVAKSILVKETWHIHKKFSQNFADYGWLLTVLPNLKIAHCTSGIYYYRSHSSQMSREPNEKHDWSSLSKLWIQNFIDAMKELSFDANDLAQNFEKHNKISLAIAFPSTLPDLNKNEFTILVETISQLRRKFHFKNDKDKKALQILLLRRGFFATRGKKIVYLSQMAPIIYEVILSFLKGVRPRFNGRV